MTGKRIAIICLVLLALAAVYVVTQPPKPEGAADLLAERYLMQCRHPGEVAKEVPVSQHEPVDTGDEINTNQTGLGILTFADFLRVEVFRKTELQVRAAPDPNAPLIVKLYLALGTTLQELQERAGEHVVVITETDWATITSVSTKYLVSVDEDGVTSVVVYEGKAEVKAQQQTVTVKAGQATFVEPRKAPRSPIDAEMGAMDDWLERLRETGEVGLIRSVILPPEEEDQTDPWLEVGHSPGEPDEEQPVTVIAEAGDDESGLDRIEIQMPDQPLVTCWDSHCEATGGPYPEGEFDYEVGAFDRAGNMAHWVGSITVVPREAEDRTDPWLEVWHSPEGPDETQEVTVVADAGDDESGLDRIEIEMPGQPLVTCWELSCKATGGPYPAGEFSYEVRAFDRAGNVAYRESHFAVAATVVQDNPPVVEKVYVESATIYQGEEFRIKLVASDDVGLQAMRWRIEGTGDKDFDQGREADCAGITWCEFNWDLKWTGQDGRFIIHAQARDTADQLSSMESTAITVLPIVTLSLSMGGGPFDDESVQEAVGLAINWAALRDAIGEVVLVDFLSGDVLADSTEPAYDPERAKELLAEAGYYGFDAMLLFDRDDELAASLAELVTDYLYAVEIYPKYLWVASADARTNFADMIAAGESGLLIERR